MLKSLIESLDRQWAAVDAWEGVRFAAHLFRFYEFLCNDPRIRTALSDARDEERRSVAAFHDAEQQAIHEITKLRTDLCHGVPSIAAAMTATENPPEFAQDKSHFDQLVQQEDGHMEPGELPSHPGRAKTLTQILSSSYISQAPKDVAASFRQQLNTVERSIDAAWRKRHLDALTNGGAALARIESVLQDLNPNKNVSDLEDAFWRAGMKDGGTGALYGELYSTPLAPKTNIGTTLLDLRNDTRIVYEDVRRRLSSTRSLLAVMERFKHRCEWFDAGRLRKLVQGDSKKGENLLTEQLALFLFDQGLQPFTEPMMGRLRPDLVNFGPWHLYVESKLANGPQYVKEGAYQLWNTVMRIRGEGFPIQEVFYVVFRVQGANLILPSAVRGGEVTMYPMFIDIAEGKVSGSNQKDAPTELAAGDLAPGNASAS